MITEEQRDKLWEFICKYERTVAECAARENEDHDRFWEGRQDYACSELDEYINSLVQK